ncbi:MAG TPA: flagellar biosynthesis protein [Burkholderiaceae bacterium]|nr:flagellar biosynthesis protein [Burkholderiaceae bacterium]
MLDRGIDQAHGLRRLFAHHTVHLVPVAANPFVPGSPLLLEGLCQGLAAQGQHTLVVEAAPAAQAAGVDVAGAIARDLDLGQWIDEFDAHTCVLAATPGSLACFGENEGAAALLFEALREAAPSADVVLFHAEAAVLAGLFAGRRVRPLVLSGDDAESLKHAYASIKVLAQYGGLVDHAVVMDCAQQAMGVPQAAVRLMRCAQDFLRAQARLAAVTCTLRDGEHVLAQTLHQLSMNLLHHALPFSLQDGEASLWGAMAGTQGAASGATQAFN